MALAIAGVRDGDSAKIGVPTAGLHEIGFDGPGLSGGGGDEENRKQKDAHGCAF
jgi:hypothetical protein